MKATFAAAFLLAAALMAVGCGPAKSATEPEFKTDAAPVSAESAGREETPSLPPPLTSAPPTDLAWSSPNGRSREESLRIEILTQWKHSTVEEASLGVPFEPRLPAETMGATLEYLLTSYRDVNPGTSNIYGFKAVYSKGDLQVAQWTGHGPGRQSINGKARGFPAAVSEGSDGVAILVWEEDSVVFQILFAGTVEDAVRIAESIPR